MPQLYRYCSVINCTSKYLIKNKTADSIRFFCFPRNPERYEKWKKFCRNPKLNNLKPTNMRNHYFICSYHFTEEDFWGSIHLKRNAVPSVLHNSSSLSHHESIQISPAQTSSPPTNNRKRSFSTSTTENTNRIIESKRKKEECPKMTHPTSKADSLTLASLNTTRKRVLIASSRKTYLYGYVKKKEDILKKLRKKYAQRKMQTLSVRDICTLKPEDLVEIIGLSGEISMSTLTLLVSQLKCSRRKPKGRKWSFEETIMALSLYKKDPKVYHLLRCMFTLPSKGTLNTVLSAVSFTTGINEAIFTTLTSTVGQMEDCDKLCVLLFDEMYIREQLFYDSTVDQIHGVEDHGDQGRSSELANHVLVFMVCGLLKKWKQPVAFYFSTKKKVYSNILVKHIQTVISACKKTGLHILATLCDTGSTNMHAVKKLGATTQNPSFSFEGRDIITLFDPPHLIKCTRNMLQKNDVEFQVKTGNLECEGKASWSHIVETYNRDKKAGTFRLLWKITDQHIDPSFKKKMKVKLATQVLSHTVAALIMKDVSLGLMSSEAAATANFVELCDNLFDSFNGVKERDEGGKELRCSITSVSPHHKFWDEVYTSVDTWKFKSSKPGEQYRRPPSQDGWLMTITGMRRLWDVVKKQKQTNWTTVKHLIPRSINLDTLENAFWSIRSHSGSNCSPNVNQFVGAFKTCIINGLVCQDVRQRGNCEEDGATLLSNLQTLLTCPLGTSKPSSGDVDMHEQIVDKFVGLSHKHNKPNDLTSTAYVSGFIARILLANNNCHGCRAGLLNSNPEKLCCSGVYFQEFSNQKLRLTYPSVELVKAVGHCSTLMEQMLEKQFHRNRVMETITNTIRQEVNFNWFKVYCSLHYDNVIEQIAKIVCNIGIPWWCKKMNRSSKENASLKKLKPTSKTVSTITLS